MGLGLGLGLGLGSGLGLGLGSGLGLGLGLGSGLGLWHHGGLRVALDLEDDARALHRALVADVRDACELLLVDQRGDLLEQPA